jgi:enoyl-CoA hydratase/carnithine racemase
LFLVSVNLCRQWIKTELLCLIQRALRNPFLSTFWLKCMEYTHLVVEIHGRTLVITLNRPSVLNVLNPQVRQEVLEVLKSYEANNGVRCVVFTGAGKAFSAGADIKHLVGINTLDAAQAYASSVREFLTYIENYPKITVGAVNGVAFGGGLELLLTLDLVVASEDARFAQSELNVGLIPGGGGTQRLPRIVGLRRAKLMVLTGEPIDANTALSWGLVNLVVPKEQLLERTLELCEKLGSKSSGSLMQVKKLLNNSLQLSLNEGLTHESEAYSHTLISDDAKEGLNAFLEKRSPKYLD